MGIPKYHKWLTERYPQAFTEAQAEKADHVYVDVNALLHDVMRHATSEDGFFSHLFTKFDSLFRTVAPGKSVFLAVDGPASCAKCLTQRQRRRAHAQKDAKNPRGAKGGKGKGKACTKGGGASQLSNNMLTPGVPFMTKLTSALEYYCLSRMKPNGLFARCEAVTVSGANAIGEGEHKIVSQMLRNAGSAADRGAAPESHVIFSGDADIFLLSLVQSACRRVRVVSERPDAPGGGAKRYRGPVLQIWNAEVLAGYIERELTKGPGAARASSGEAALRRDFALVSLLAGNDYLPELRCSLSPQKLWEQYLKLRQGRFPRQALVQAELTSEGLPPSHLDGGWAQTVGESGAAFAVEPYEHYSFFPPLLSELMKAASAGSPGRMDAGGKAAEGVRKYLEGLLWILEMYHHGYCADFYFVLEKSLHSFASASLIVQFLATSEATGAEPLTPSRSEQPPMRPLACGLCILPVQHAEQFLCPAAPGLQPMFTVDHPLLGSVNSIERSEELKDCKAKVTQFQQEMMRLRAQGLDDSKAKAQLTLYSQKMQSVRQGGSDIDVVPLPDIDAEVAERCEGLDLASLGFAPDVTLARSAGCAPVTLQPPARNMPPAHLPGVMRVTGEWPQASGAPQTQDGACAEEEEEWADVPGEEPAAEEAEPAEDEEEAWVDVEEEAPAEVLVPGGEALAAGDGVEGYWPDDDAWLPATIQVEHEDGTLTITWDQDGSQSDVPADYVRKAADAGRPVKRARLLAR
mmetsp:Transcript_37356/g.115181  ORF Transcript_37356/g.115181 Transcript_37356/m.115181 type:complete len:746 (-) Transcript_37356:60-2297(-)